MDDKNTLTHEECLKTMLEIFDNPSKDTIKLDGVHNCPRCDKARLEDVKRRAIADGWTVTE